MAGKKAGWANKDLGLFLTKFYRLKKYVYNYDYKFLLKKDPDPYLPSLEKGLKVEELAP